MTRIEMHRKFNPRGDITISQVIDKVLNDVMMDKEDSFTTTSSGYAMSYPQLGRFKKNTTFDVIVREKRS